MKKYFSILDIVGQRVMKKKIQELTYPSTTFMCPPPVKYKSKMDIRRVKRVKRVMCIVILRSWSVLKARIGSHTTKISCTKPIERQSCSVSSKLKYLSQFPVFLHQYIDDIVDVGDDENCCSIAALLGWGE